MLVVAAKHYEPVLFCQQREFRNSPVRHLRLRVRGRGEPLNAVWGVQSAELWSAVWTRPARRDVPYNGGEIRRWRGMVWDSKGWDWFGGWPARGREWRACS